MALHWNEKRLLLVKYLYRILALFVITPQLAVPNVCAAQGLAPQKKTRSRLRAVSVLQIPGGAAIAKDMQVPSTAKLYPVTVFTNGEYQDATIYDVNPMPMALEPGTVYDVQQGGESMGLFTVESASKAKEDWLAAGRWRSAAAIAAAKHPAHEVHVEETDAPPKLRRGGGEAAKTEAPAVAPPAPAPASKPSPEPSAEPTAPPAAQGSIPAPSPASDTDPSEADPNRPELRRRGTVSAGGLTPPTQVQRKPRPAPIQSKPVSARVPIRQNADLPSPSLKRRPKPEPQFLVAISDADPYETRSYAFPWTKDEQKRLTDIVQKQALAELAAYAAKHDQSMVSGSFVPSIHAFDLDLSNDAELVLTARCALRKKLPSAASVNAYITYVARQELTGDLRKLFSEVTDDERLDVTERMELVDAVDADGDSHAELLFRRIGATTQSFALYRAGRDQMWKLFEGADTSK